MSTYLVRLKVSNELVGLFWAENMSQLFDVVDEACDPFSCEAKKLQFGGIFWANSIDVTMPLVDDGSDDFFDDIKPKLNGFSFSDMTLSDMFETKGWQSIEKKMEKTSNLSDYVLSALGA